MDTHTPEQRHKNMQNIRSENTVPEKLIMRALKEKGIYFTKHRKDVFGKPDIVFKRKKVAVFIDSDFWHCNPDCYREPKNNSEYWKKKTECNKERDKEVNEHLQAEGCTICSCYRKLLMKKRKSQIKHSEGHRYGIDKNENHKRMLK